MRLRYTARAFRDLDEISDYIRAHNPYAAERIAEAIRGSLKVLEAFPDLGRRQDVSGVRKLVTRRYPYLVYYRVDRAADEIVILTVRHPSREREHEDA